MKLLVFLCLLPAAFAGYLESVAASVAAGSPEPFQGMVAFKCGRPSIHLTPSGGWVRDLSQDCVANSDEVKAYCQRMYPNIEVVNVEPAPYKVRITNWCDFSKKSCSEAKENSIMIHPYRCLAAGFQSDALLVPSNCTFHHVVPGMSSDAKDQKKECKEYNEWKVTAASECNKMSSGRRKLSSFSGLLDCKKDENHKFSYFEGVEFVCCPASQLSQPPTEGLIVEPVVKEPKTTKRDPYVDYLNRAEDNKDTEHDRYVAAKESRKRGMTKDEDRLVRTYIEAERNLDNKWQVDQDTTDKEEQLIIQRFRAAFTALLDEEMAELRQLDHVHQERVFLKLRAKSIRNKKMLEYAIQETDPKLDRISAATFSFLRAVMKEKVHAINHYSHLLDSDTVEAKKQLPNLRQYLQKLHKDIKEILTKITTSLPTLSKEMRTRVLKFMDTYSEVESSANSLENKGVLPDGPITGQSRKEVEIEHMESVIKAYRHQQAKKPVVHVEPVPEVTSDLDTEVSLEKKGEFHEELHQARPLGPQHSAKAMMNSRHHEGGNHDHDNDGEEDHLPENHPRAEIVSGNSLSMWAIIGSVAGVALIAAISALLVLRRKYSGYTRSPHSDPAVVAIERSVAPSAVDEATNGDIAAMQTNGYENPTYKYFELKGQEQDGDTAKA